MNRQVFQSPGTVFLAITMCFIPLQHCHVVFLFCQSTATFFSFLKCLGMRVGSFSYTPRNSESGPRAAEEHYGPGLRITYTYSQTKKAHRTAPRIHMNDWLSCSLLV
ncbi:hypothetical protein DFH05DRAFT_887534 [Lentinula detonsa]|uniref:Uncharacterized protein n=1 Tax=Lentinula detonsa TaxID=2804962 RepID=A0A9W8P718_9AGAR|nr:hypothetical protein DFH05DRAFT_887534 [Lentinula detonsa]